MGGSLCRGKEGDELQGSDKEFYNCPPPSPQLWSPGGWAQTLKVASIKKHEGDWLNKFKPHILYWQVSRFRKVICSYLQEAFFFNDLLSL